MVGGGGVEVKYDEVGSSMGGMARLRRVAASSWAGVSCARVSWARMLFSARVDGIGPFSSSIFGKQSLKSSKHWAVLSAELLGVNMYTFRLTRGQYEYFLLDLSDLLHGCPSWACNTSVVSLDFRRTTLQCQYAIYVQTDTSHMPTPRFIRCEAMQDPFWGLERERSVFVSAFHLGARVDGVQVKPRHRVPWRPMEPKNKLILLEIALGIELHQLSRFVDHSLNEECVVGCENRGVTHKAPRYN